MKEQVIRRAKVRSVLTNLLLCLLPIGIYAQPRVFILDLDSRQISTEFSYTHYNLSTSLLYGIEGRVELFNLMPLSEYNKSDLIVFSVLPNFSGKESWTSLDSISYREVSFGELLRLKDKSLSIVHVAPYFSRYLNDIKLGVRKDGQVKVADMCLLQFFAIRSYPENLNRPFGTIDTGQRTLTIREFEQEYKRSYPKDHFPMIPGALSINFEPLRMKREFLSRKFTIKNEQAYQFWTFYDWSTRDGYETERGIDRFVYIPGKGIVGGSYDFYFKSPLPKEYPAHPRRNITMSQFIENIYEERVMLAEGIE